MKKSLKFLPKGEEVDFETIKEEWNEYHLSDGTVLKVKLALIKVLRTDQYNEFGEPVYAFQSTNIVKTRVPATLKKKASVSKAQSMVV